MNDPIINDNDGILTHEPTSNPREQIATTKACPIDDTPASKNVINRSAANYGESLSHVPTPCRSSHIVTLIPILRGVRTW